VVWGFAGQRGDGAAGLAEQASGLVEPRLDRAFDDLIAELETYMVQPDGQYRHKWHVGDIVIWDNRCSYHRAAGDYPPHEDRIHWRVSIKEPESQRLAAE